MSCPFNSCDNTPAYIGGAVTWLSVKAIQHEVLIGMMVKSRYIVWYSVI